MPRTITSVSVFLASPSDVNHERNVVSAAIDEWNNRHGRDQSLTFDLLRWESSISAGFSTDGQDVINSQINDEYDVLIALFWAKLGTPTPRAVSGTVEEYRRALGRFKSGEKVDIAFFFKDAPIDFRAIDLEQLKALRDFEREVQDAGALTKSFKDDDGLKLEISILLDRIARTYGSTDVNSRKEAVRLLSTGEGPTGGLVLPDSDDDDVGILDAAENLEVHAGQATEFLTGLTQHLEGLAAVTSAITDEYGEIKKLRPLSFAEAKPGIQRISNSMDSFSAFLEAESSAYTESVVAAASDIRDMIRVSYDFIDGSDDPLAVLQPFRHQIVVMYSAMGQSLAQMNEMIETTTTMQRTTSQFNKSKRRLVRNLIAFVNGTESSRALVGQALEELDRLILAALKAEKGTSSALLQ